MTAPTSPLSPERDTVGVETPPSETRVLALTLAVETFKAARIPDAHAVGDVVLTTADRYVAWLSGGVR